MERVAWEAIGAMTFFAIGVLQSERVKALFWSEAKKVQAQEAKLRKVL